MAVLLLLAAASYDGKYAGEPAFERAREEVDRVAAAASRDLSRVLGLAAPGGEWLRLQILDARPAGADRWVVTAEEPFQTGGPDRDGIVTIRIHAEALVNGRYVVERQIRHEMVHALMRHRLEERHALVPRWFREGLAVHLAGQGEERIDLLLSQPDFAQHPERLTDGLPPGEISGGDYPQAYLRVKWLEEEGLLAEALAHVLGGGELRRILPAGWEAQADSFARAGVTAHCGEAFRLYAEVVRVNTQGDATRLRDVAERCLAADPEGPFAVAARYFHAKALSNLGREDEAEAEFRSLAAPPGRPGDWCLDDGMLRLGALLRRRGRPAEALDVLRRLVRDFPDDAATPSSAYEYAFALSDAGAQEAQDELERAVRSFPDRPEAAEARRRLSP